MAVNAWDEPKSTVKKFTKDYKLNVPVLLDGGSVAHDYQCEGVPVSFWIDRDGVIRDRVDGARGHADLRRRTMALLR